MLQPLQLKDVSFRYPDEIAELRDFLAKAGFTLGTVETLGSIAAVLPRDRAFHRDLTSYIWVLIDRCERPISPSDLLGVLAIAAAGMRLAAAADEDAAHDLLRFLLEARRSLEGPTHDREISPQRPVFAEEMESAPVLAEAPIPTPAAEERLPQRLSNFATAAEANAPLPVTEEHPPQRSSNFITGGEPAEQPIAQTAQGRRENRMVWLLAIAVCLLAAVVIGLWQYCKPVAKTGSVAPVVGAPAAVTSVAPSREERPSTSIGEAVDTEPVVAPQVRVAPRTMDRALSRSARIGPVPTVRTAAPATSYPAANGAADTRAPIVRMPPPANAAVATVTPSARSLAPTPASAGIIPRAGSARPATPVAVPAASLSKQLGSSTIPAYASQPDPDATTDGRKYPRLLRRRTTSAMADAALVADLRTPATGTPGHAAPAGVVRPTSIGIMAGNLVYSPTPAYPAAASAAGVQGEVKIQAEVDQDGNVVSARVVSGPPPLRDAAVDAVQHWRYKPYISHGKPVPMSAIAVVDFQLP